MKTTPRFLLIACLLFALILLTSCGDDDSTSENDPHNANDYVEIGKRLLKENEGFEAADAFIAALALQPDNQVAKYGMVLSGSMELFNFIDQVLGTFNSMTFESDPTQVDENFSSITEAADDQPIHEYLLEKIVWRLEASDAAYRELAEYDDVQITLDSYVWSIDEAPLLTFGGEFDQADLHFFGAANALALALFDFLLAHDLRFDYTLLAFPETEDDVHILETINTIVQLIDNLFDSQNFPHFLYLQLEYGEDFMKAAGVDLGDVFARLDLAFAYMAEETDDQEDDQVAYIDSNGNGHFDVGVEEVFLGAELSLDAALAEAIANLCPEMADIFYEGSPLDYNPNEERLLSLADFNELLTALGVLPLDLGLITLPALPDWFGLDVGGFFSRPAPDGIREFIHVLVTLWLNPSDLFN